MMNRFFTLLLAISCLTAVGQHEVDNVCCDPDSYDFDVVDCVNTDGVDGWVDDVEQPRS